MPPRRRLLRRHDAQLLQEKLESAASAKDREIWRRWFQARRLSAGCREVSSAHLQAAACHHDARQRRVRFRLHGEKVSGFPRRHRRQRARARTSAHCQSDSPRSRARDSSFQPLPQRVSGTSGAQARGMVRARSRVLREQRHGSRRWRDEAGAAPWPQSGGVGRHTGEKAPFPGFGEFLSWPYVWRCQCHSNGEIPPALCSGRPWRGVCPP